MRYTFFVAFKGIKQNLKIYFVLFIELILCFSLIYIGLNKNHSEQERLSLLDQTEQNSMLTNYAEIRQEMSSSQRSELEMNLFKSQDYIFATSSQVYIEKDGKSFSVPVIIANDAFITEYVEDNAEDTDIFIGKDISKEITTAEELKTTEKYIEKRENDWYFYDTKLVEKISPHFKLNIMPTSIVYFRDIQLDHSIIIKVDKLVNYPLNDIFVYNVILRLNGTPETIAQKIEKLNSILEEPLSIQGTPIKELTVKGSQDLMEFISVFSWASQIAFLIVFVGVLGILLIFMEKRKKKFIMSVILGASTLRVLIEMFTEIFLVSAIANVFALIIVSVLQPSFSSVYYLIEFSPQTLVLALVLPLVLALVPVLFLARNFLKFNLLELKKYGI